MSDPKPRENPFSEVALEYARHYEPLEVARAVWQRERDDLLKELGERAVAAFGRAGLSATLARHAAGPDSAYHYLDLQGAFVQAKRDRGVNVRRSDGCQILCGATDDGLEIAIELYFRMKRWRYDELLFTLQSLTDGGKQLRFGDDYAWIELDRVSVIDPGWSRARLDEAIDAAPRAFAKADEALAAAVRASGREPERGDADGG